jgi:hypothetical protein
MHHTLATGPLTAIGFALPFLAVAFIFVVLAAVRWAGRAAEILLSRFRAPAAPVRSLARGTPALGPVLASDPERDEAAGRVSQAIAEGRLSMEEGLERIEAVLRCRHRHEIARLVADLPVRAAVPTGGSPAVAPLRRGLLAIAAALVVAALLVQVMVGLWVLWPLAVVALGGAALLPQRTAPQLTP